LGLAALAAAMAAAVASADDTDLLNRLRQKAQAEDAQREKEFGVLLEQGRQFLEKNEHEQALQVLRRAAALKPQDEACRQLLAQARAALASRQPAEILDRVRGQWKSRKNTLRRELDLGLFEAEQALADQRFDKAAQHAQRVLHGAGYVGDGALAQEFRARAQRILDRADAHSREAQSAKRKQALADRRREATERASTDSLRDARERGWKHLEHGDYKKALAAAEQMLEHQPGSEQGRFLKSEALKAKERAEDVDRAREERKQAITDHMVRDLEKQMTLPEGVAEESKVVLPGKAKGRQPHVPKQAMEPWEQQLRAKLRTQVTFEFKNSSATQACRYLAELTESTILVDPAVAKDARRVSLPKMTLSFDHALRWLCRFWRATYVIRDHAILVTRRGGRLNEPVIRDYDVSGLLMPLRSVRTTLDSSTQFDEDTPLHAVATTGLEVKEKPADKETIGEGWAAFIRSTVEPDSWSDGPGSRTLQQQGPRYSIQYRNGRIVVVHTPEVHRQIADLLANYRRARNLQVHLLARFLTLELDYLQEIGVNFAGNQGDPDDPFDDTFGFVDPREAPPDNPNRDWQRWEVNANIRHEHEVGDIPGSFSSDELGGLRIGYHYLNHAEVMGVLSAVIKHRKGTLLIAPRLTCFNTQRANFQALTNYNYVRSVDADEEPEIGNVPDGIIFDVQPFISADRRYVTVVLQPQLRTLQSLESFSFLGGPLGRAVQLPTTQLTSVATTVTVPDGGSIIIGGLSEVNERHGLATLPFFYSVPGLRYLLRETRDAERRTSLVVMVTAEIVRDIFEEE
jgi:tetratricopeptide (TPR) repeat protein